ncbi:DEAD/DEAH box helicase family protein [Candidatus Pacearchaeota archaeon]|nr:DEAD/DEAH box helicase family protein [Candidatus Pacearchaeota archaeon]
MPNERSPEVKARHNKINPKLVVAGWDIQDYKTADVRSSKGVAVEYFQMGKGVGEADYVLFVNGIAVGVVEAKKEGVTLIGKETQTKGYAEGFSESFRSISLPLPFIYESNGNEVRFTNLWDPKPRSREVFNFHRPETFEEWMKHPKDTLRGRLTKIPPVDNKRLRRVQEEAINNLLSSLAKDKPRALVQMATGSGKTLMAVNLCNDLIEKGKAKRVLFLVDRYNLGEQTEQEFQNFEVPGDGRKFTELHNVHLLKSNKIKESDKVCIATIQRVYSMISGKELDVIEEQKSGFEQKLPSKPIEVKYNPNFPVDSFDVIIVDECHRSIYNLWKQVLDYFDAYLIGLTATPSKSTIAFFNSNLVMEYGHEQAVADEVNVDFTVYNIKTKISRQGSKIETGEVVIKRDRRTREKRWHKVEDEVIYNASELDRKVTSKDQIRKVIRTFKEKLFTEIFPGRKHVPKTLIYAKDDNHAEEIVEIVREEFGEGNEFCQKITYRTEGIKPEDLIRQFRNSFNPRIAVTVDMIATGTDIKPLEIVFFMRAVKSRNYFEQMKGRGVRVMNNQDFMSITPDAQAKERFVIVDAVGVCESEDLNESRPLEQFGEFKLNFEKLLKSLQYGNPTKELVSSLVSRLSRLQKKLTEEQTNEITKITNGKTLKDFAKELVDSIDEDKIFEQAQKEFGEKPNKEQIEKVSEKRMDESLKSFIGNAKLIERLPEIKKETEIIVDEISLDVVEEAQYSEIATKKAKEVVGSFKEFIQKNKTELAAIQIFYNKGKLHWNDLKELYERIKAPPYALTPGRLWQAYKQLEEQRVKGRVTDKQITNFISLLRFEIEKTKELEPYLDTVDKRFSEWLARQREEGVQFSDEQLRWLMLIKDHIATSVEILKEDLEDAPFNQLGGLGKAAKVFGQKLTPLLKELNEKVGG